MAGATIVTVVGNLTDDPELRFLESGVAMSKFTVASTERTYDSKAQQWKDGDPLFMRCTAWRQLAEHVAESLSRGTRVVVTGRLRQSQWETPEGQKRSSIDLDVEEIGPSLKFATAKVNKMARSKGGDGFTPDNPPDDAWSSATPAGANGASRSA
jgi:single-strand DNA-binding protein